MQRTAIILACLFICTICFAQQSPFVHYTPKDGLVNSRVRKAYQDSKGRMYFLTYGGLTVFDGARFRNYTMNDGLASTLVNDVLEVGDDSLLVACNSGHYVNVLVRGKMKNLNPKLGCPLINQFYRHSDGMIYAASDYGLFQLKGNEFRKLNISPLMDRTQNIPFVDVMTGFGKWLIFSVTETNSLRGIYLYDISNDRVVDSLISRIYLIQKDHFDRIWVSKENQLYTFDTSELLSGKLALSSLPESLSLLKNYNVAGLAFKDSLAWFICRDKQLRNIEVMSFDQTGLRFRQFLPDEIGNSILQHVLIDRENSIWLSNDGEGVYKIARSPLQRLELPQNSSKETLIYHAFCHNQSSWLSAIGSMFYELSDEGIKAFKVNKDKLQVFHVDGNKILARDETSMYEGRIMPSQQRIEFKSFMSSKNVLFGRNLLIDKYNNIIAIQSNGLGVWKQGKLIFLLPNRAKEDMSDKIEFDKLGRLWCINRYTGIDVYSLHPENERNYLRSELYFPKEMIKGSPRSLVIDKRGLIWIGTRDNGVYAFRNVGDKLLQQFHFHTGNQLTDNFVSVLACDSLNNIIVGTQTGVDRIVAVDHNSYRVENLSRSRNHFAFINDTWSTGIYGYALSMSGQVFQILPTANWKTIQPPNLLLEELKINSRSAGVERSGFSHKENNITFLVAAPSFIDEKQVFYAYMLEGSGNEQWSDSSTVNSTINLTNLSAGHYVLKVKAFFPSSTYEPADLIFPFEIRPPWWQTWWFRIGMGLVVIGILVFVFRFYYRRKLEKQMAILERQQAIEKERTRIATDMHDDLGAGLSRIKFLSETIGLKQQQKQTVDEEISSIRNYSHEMIDKMGEIVWALNEKNDTLSDLLSYTRGYAVEYLSQNGIKCIVEFPEQFPQTFVSGEFRRNIYLTVKEALHNIVKHAQATVVFIKIHVNHDLNIQIKDDGKGFDRTVVRAFSNGLANMESRINETGGMFEIISDNGTAIRIKVPLLV